MDTAHTIRRAGFIQRSFVAAFAFAAMTFAGYSIIGVARAQNGLPIVPDGDGPDACSCPEGGILPMCPVSLCSCDKTVGIKICCPALVKCVFNKFADPFPTGCFSNGP